MDKQKQEVNPDGKKNPNVISGQGTSLPFSLLSFLTATVHTQTNDSCSTRNRKSSCQDKLNSRLTDSSGILFLSLQHLLLK